MSDKLPLNRIRTPEPTLDTLVPGSEAFISIFALKVETDHTLKVIRTAKLAVVNDAKERLVPIGRDRDGTFWVDIRSQPDYKFKGDMLQLAADYSEMFFTIDRIIIS